MPLKKLYTFTVKGRCDFPIDMLRYDTCWPNGYKAVSEIGFSQSAFHKNAIAEEGHEPETFEVEIASWKEPTPKRWLSQGWTVSKLECQRVQ